MPRSKTILYAALQYMFVFFGLIEKYSPSPQKSFGKSGRENSFSGSLVIPFGLLSLLIIACLHIIKCIIITLSLHELRVRSKFANPFIFDYRNFIAEFCTCQSM